MFGRGFAARRNEKMLTQTLPPSVTGTPQQQPGWMHRASTFSNHNYRAQDRHFSQKVYLEIVGSYYQRTACFRARGVCETDLWGHMRPVLALWHVWLACFLLSLTQTKKFLSVQIPLRFHSRRHLRAHCKRRALESDHSPILCKVCALRSRTGPVSWKLCFS